MLVALRLAIGWHFYSEGTKHFTERDWSSEGFLRQAKGPFAPLYRAVLPDDFHWDATLNAPPVGGAQADAATAAAVERLRQQIDGVWDKFAAKFVSRYPLTAEQKTATAKIVMDRKAILDDWLKDNTDAIADYRHDSQRLRQAEEQPSSADVPFQIKRIADAKAKVAAQSTVMEAEVHAIETGMILDLQSLLDEKQSALGPFLPCEHVGLDRFDALTKYGILAIGVCLVLGLFTRLAAIGGALFLLSVVLSQPFWVADSIPTYNQIVEMLALGMLATTRAGQWAGLDFFLSRCCGRCCSATKGNGNESHS